MSKGCVREIFGGAPMDPALGLTFRDSMAGYVTGMGRYVCYMARAPASAKGRTPIRQR